jgi:hypothetical protein
MPGRPRGLAALLASLLALLARPALAAVPSRPLNISTLREPLPAARVLALGQTDRRVRWTSVRENKSDDDDDDDDDRGCTSLDGPVCPLPRDDAADDGEEEGEEATARAFSDARELLRAIEKHIEAMLGLRATSDDEATTSDDEATTTTTTTTTENENANGAAETPEPKPAAAPPPVAKEARAATTVDEERGAFSREAPPAALSDDDDFELAKRVVVGRAARDVKCDVCRELVRVVHRAAATAPADALDEDVVTSRLARECEVDALDADVAADAADAAATPTPSLLRTHAIITRAPPEETTVGDAAEASETFVLARRAPGTSLREIELRVFRRACADVVRDGDIAIAEKTVSAARRRRGEGDGDGDGNEDVVGDLQRALCDDDARMCAAETSSAAMDDTKKKKKKKKKRRKKRTETCYYHAAGWWNYEICRGGAITQYHADAGGVTRVALGTYDAATTSRRKTRDAADANAVGVEIFTRGATCEGARANDDDEPAAAAIRRGGEARFYCARDGATSVEVNEPETCVYDIRVRSPRLCDEDYA